MGLVDSETKARDFDVGIGEGEEVCDGEFCCHILKSIKCDVLKVVLQGVRSFCK